MSKIWKQGDDIYLKGNGEKYYGKVVNVQGNIVSATFGTNEIFQQMKKNLVNESHKYRKITLKKLVTQKTELSVTPNMNRFKNKTEEIKLDIIENFIDHFTSDEDERERMKFTAKDYIAEDHVNEILQSLNINEDNLGIHTNCQNCGASTNL